MASPKEVRKAIKALVAAWEALEAVSTTDPRDSVSRLRSDINEYATYLESATWWRK